MTFHDCRGPEQRATSTCKVSARHCSRSSGAAYPLRSAGSAVAYYLQDGKEPFGKLIAPTGERLYSGRPPRHAAETRRDKDEEAAAAVAALGEFATPAEARICGERTRWCSRQGTDARSSRGTSTGPLTSGAGVRRITIHDTRRTCGSLLAALDVHPRVAMAILRHSRIALTMEIYTQVPDKTTRDALRRLSDWLGQGDDELGPRGADKD